MKLINNDEESLRLFARCVANWSYSLILSYVHNKEDAEELTQDTLIAALKSIKNFKAEAKLKTWVCSIAINKSKDFIKFKKRNKRSFLRNAMEIKSEQNGKNYATDCNNPDRILQSKDAVNDIMHMIDQLPGKQKDVIILCKLEKRSIKETASILMTSPKAIESLLGRAKKNLKEKLIRKESFEMNIINTQYE